MKPYYSHAGITIYHGDCREILPGLRSFELLLTDIPYGEVNRASSGLRGLDKGSADVVTASPEWVAATTAGMCRTAYVFCGFGQISDLHWGYKRRGLTTRLCQWEKTNPSPMNGEHLWLSAVEPCVFARASGAIFHERCASPVWRYPSLGDAEHPTAKPVKLIRRLVSASSNADSMVVDPFMGSGTTLVAAKDLGRAAVGIEIEERYCEIAAKRLSQEVLDFGAVAR